MKNGKLIIGVVGASRKMAELPNGKQITQLAWETGREITISQHILLSGGKPLNNNPSRVHSAAMDGAAQAGKKEKPARLISTLREQKEYRIGYTTEPTCRHLTIYTDFGDERNFMNGYLPDVMIAIYGGKGTLSEIAFAHFNQIPVIFMQTDEIDTLQELKKYTQATREILDNTKKEFEFNITAVSKTDDLLNEATNIAGSAKEAVLKAIGLAGKRANDLPRNTHLDALVKEYKLKLEALADE